MAKVFSKTEWLKSATADKEEGVLTEREINDALEIWVNDFDGKTQAEIGEKGISLREDWLVEKQ